MILGIYQKIKMKNSHQRRTFKACMKGLIITGLLVFIPITGSVHAGFREGVENSLNNAAGSALDSLGNSVKDVLNIKHNGTNDAGGSNGPVFHGTGLTGGADIVRQRLDDGVSKATDVKELIVSWTNFLLPIAATVAVLAIVWAGFLYITAFGDEGRMDSAKKIIIWVVVGILIIAAAYAIVKLVMDAAF